MGNVTCRCQIYTTQRAHLGKVDGLQSQEAQALLAIAVGLRGGCDTTASGLGPHTVLEVHVGA